MSELSPPAPNQFLSGDEEDEERLASRLAQYVRGGGVVVPLLTVLIAFVFGGLVVLITGHNPLTTYENIFNGAGLNWFFPWVSGDDRATAASNLQQTLIATTPLILVGLAVAFAFRGGLFNIGGQGQYIVGSIIGVEIGSSFASMPHVPHVLLAIVCGALGGAAWAGIAGLLKAVSGANEVISTIMLNWVAIWVGVWMFSEGGPLQDPHTPDVPQSNPVVGSAKLHVFWGNPALQGLHIGLFIALGMVVVFWLLLNRSTAGYEMRAVGFNPDAAQSSGINVPRSYVRVMAISGAFAGLAGVIDTLGWNFQIATNNIQFSTVGFLGIAVALLGRNTASGTVGAAFLFGALSTGTAGRNNSSSFDPALLSNLTLLIQGMIVLLVSTDVIALRILRGGRGLVPGRLPPPAPAQPPPPPDDVIGEQAA